MTTLVQLIIGISLSLFLTNNEVNTPIKEYVLFIDPASNISKKKTFNILENKCNVCHSKRNKSRVFTLKNMDTWSDDIYQQVFIKKRMPKGKKVKLTSEDYKELLTWISSIKNQN